MATLQQNRGPLGERTVTLYMPAQIGFFPSFPPPERAQEKQAMSIRSWLAAFVCVALISGCGYSEDEWQAQLAKYGQLDQKHQAEAAERQRTQAELDKAQGQIAELKQQLQKMGVNLDTINQQLEQTGSQNKHLSKNIEELQRALKEYQERAAQLERIKQRFELLRDKLKKLTELGLKVEIRRNRMVIRLPGDVLFASGDDKLSKEGDAVVAAVAEVIRNDKQLSGRYFQVAGHTDNKPLKGGRFGDNWGLSAMRARRRPRCVPGRRDGRVCVEAPAPGGIVCHDGCADRTGRGWARSAAWFPRPRP
jgi:chemotaxis protein MotB